MMGEKEFQFGVDYHPEHADRSLWESDAKRMKDMGVRLVRMMEFAWIILEPQEGSFDFSLFDEVIDIFAGHGIKAVLGTPTATPPVWLIEKHPDIVRISIDGKVRQFGTRRECCYNSGHYRGAGLSIVESIARHFGKNRNVVGWQIDNELGHEGTDICICDNCKDKWHAWLRKKFESVQTMNETWGTVFWGTTYSSFEQVPIPTDQPLPHNAGLQLDYYRFCSDSAVSFVDDQIAMLRKHIAPEQWISHNFYIPPVCNIIDHARMAENMDFAGYSNYPVWGDQDEPFPYYFNSYAFAAIRGFKDSGNFTIFEQFAEAQGHVCLGYLPPYDEIVLWTNHAIAHGADRLFYFPWRTPRFGSEQLGYGILDSDNAESERYMRLKRNIIDNREVHDKIVRSSIITPACLIYDKDNMRILWDQYLSKGLYEKPTPYVQAGYELELTRWFAPYVLFNINADVKKPSQADLSKYSIISLPMYQMADPEFVGRIKMWVHEGGTLVLGWRAGTRDMNNFAITGNLPGLFSELAGVKIRRFESLNKNKVKIRIGLIPAKGEVWADLLEPTTAKAVAFYSDSKKHYSGTPAVTVNHYGKGAVYYLGTSPDPVGLFILFRKIFRKSGLKHGFHGNGVEVIHRRGDEGERFKVVLNHTAKSKLVSGKWIKPYKMMVLPD
jgi:beta-galactosidase